MLYRFSMALALAASIAGCAHAYTPIASEPELLSELPADAPPGECYARVRAPAEPAGPPPLMIGGAQWVLNPGPPGSPGPIWCLVSTGPVPVATAPAVERYGWIRVLCEQDATPERIRSVQTRLHDRGYYRGEATGRYDAATAAAVGQFQSSARIDHGGYLSVQTLDVLEGQGGYAPPPPPAAVYAGGYGYQSAYAVQAPSPCLQTCSYVAAPPPPPPPPPCCQVQYAPPPPPPVYYQPAPPPCCQVQYAPPPPCCAAQAYYPQQAYAQAAYPPQVYVQQGYVQQGYSSGYASGYYAGSPTPAYAAAQAQARASAGAYAGGARASASASAYASSTSAIQNGWLTWGGMSRY